MKYWRGYLTAAILGAFTWVLIQMGQKYTTLVDMVYPYVTRSIQSFLTAWTGGFDFLVWQTAVIFLVISLDGFSIGTNFSSVMCSFNNIGPGFEAVGPTCNFSQYSSLSKLVLSWAMLAGRLEIFPILVLLSRNSWRKK